jgi:spore germination protein GerM
MRWVLIAGLLVAVASVGWYVFVALDRSGPDEDLNLTEVDEEQGTRSITVFFGNAEGDGLIDESRTIAAYRHRDEEVEAVLAELLHGPQSSGGVRTVPDGTALRQAFYDEEQRTLYLDFNEALVGEEMTGTTTERMTLAAILRTIAVDFPEVKAVQFLVNGLEVETLGGHLDLTRPLRPGDWL